MQGTKVILGTYNTMPEGCSEKIFEFTYQRSWRPYLSSLYKFQNVSAVLFYSGTVLNWIEENHPEFILLLEEMSNRKQIEILGGGYFSPLFSLLQSSDRIGQIELLTTYLRKTFGKRPSGGWLYEYSWDSAIPPVFRNAGFTYTFLPVSVLDAAGVLPRNELAPLITEDQRKLLYLFPCFDLGEGAAAPMPYERAFERIREAYPGNRLFTMMLDGNSISSMWESSGLESPDVLFEKSFAWFQKNCLEVETITVQAYAKTLRRSSLVYLSSCASRRFMTYKGRAESASAGTCAAEPARQVILSDRASKHLYDKMCYVHNLLVLLRGDKARKKSAQEDLWSAQSGDACWKGCAGGIHRPEVRFNSFRALVDAERSSRIHGSFSPGIVMDDMDCDGAREILYQAADMNCYIHERGASVIELDSFKNRCNYFASFPRESHDVYGGFLDEFHETGTFGARVLNLADQTFLLQEKDRGTQKVTFSKDFSLRQGAGTHQMSVRKSYTFQKHLVSVDIELTNRSNNPLSFRYVSCSVLQMSPELDNLVFSTQKGHDKVDLARQSLTEDLLAEALSINASGYREFLEFRSDKTFHLQMVHALGKACTPFGASGEDASPEESHTAATEVFYQGSTLRFGWDINLDADAFISLSLTLHLRT